MNEIRKGEEYEVIIEKQDHFGQGVARINGMLVFVKGALPNEKVRIQVTEIRKSFLNAQIKKIIKMSSERVESSCPYSDQCGGCQIITQEYSKQLQWKEKKVKELFQRFAGIDDIEIESFHHGKKTHYRNKVIFHGKGSSLGFYQEKTNDLVKVDHCILVEEELNKLYQKIKATIKETDRIDSLMLRMTSKKEKMMVLEGKIRDEEDFLKSIQTLVHSVYINHKLVAGKEYITEEIFGFQFQIRASAFFQVNYEMMKDLYQIVIDQLKGKKDQTVLDLYCGTGTIGILLSPHVKEVIGIEVVKDAIQSANQNKKINHISNIHFLEGRVEDLISQFKEIDSIIVDPPRSGLDKKTILAITKIAPQSIIYISCDTVTLARDLGLLLEEYKLKKVHLVDMFPNTYHVECVCILNRC